MNDPTLSHITPEGRTTMVDVGDKGISRRTARAEARIWLPEPVRQIFEGHEGQSKKGPVVATARLAGIMGAKKTSELIPLCHPIALEHVDVEGELRGEELILTASARTHGKTGVEMEALTAASVAALTVYDMCKALSHDIIIREIRLLEKTGGKHDFSRP